MQPSTSKGKSKAFDSSKQTLPLPVKANVSLISGSRDLHPGTSSKVVAQPDRRKSSEKVLTSPDAPSIKTSATKGSSLLGFGGKHRAGSSSQHLYGPLPLSSNYALQDDEDDDFVDISERSKLSLSDYEDRVSVKHVKPKSFKEIIADFCSRTSSHGIPHIAASQSLTGKLCWTLVFFACFAAFSYQTYWTIERFLNYRKIVEIELKFEAAPFPAVTICNLNPYKLSEASEIPDISGFLGAFEHAIMQGKSAQQNTTSGSGSTPPPPQRSKRAAFYQPIRVNCTCLHAGQECIPSRDPFERYFNQCLCFEERFTENIWPCYLEKLWTREMCTYCGTSGSCPHPSKLNESMLQLMDAETPTLCICQNISHFCMPIPPNFKIPNWNPFDYHAYKYSTTPDPTPSTTPSQEAIDQLEIEGMVDEVAITTKAKETLMFIATSLSHETRLNISYERIDFIFRCSFNGRECQIEKDFQVHVDPIYGSCYTFNWNSSFQLYNSRAGPLYGLRVLLNVNQSDYMPTTESAGVRVHIHNKSQYPFPDTFGYNAPAGTVSSFGLRSKFLERLSEPYSKCLPRGEITDNYIYLEDYSTEGCYRSCFQNYLISKCGCGDPRSPAPKNQRTCRHFEIRARRCLENFTEQIGDFYNIQKIGCVCYPPCEESFFEVTFSAAAWPSENYRVGNFGNECDDTNGSCVEYFRKHTAFVEIYYEQLNYEYLKEAPAYDIIELLADFGGNVGLWVGFSAITMVEFMLLLVEVIAYLCEEPPKHKDGRRRVAKYHRRDLRNHTGKGHNNTGLDSQLITTVTMDSDLDLSSAAL